MNQGEEGASTEAAPYRRPFTRAPDNPWWILPLLGRVPDVPPPKIQLLGVIALAILFENYDQAMLTAAAKQIADSFGLEQSRLAEMFGWVHLGAVGAFALVPMADRVGRRRLFLVSLIGLSLATVASGFAPSERVFILFQMVSRAFMVTCSAMAYVIITEEFPAQHRGWGIGILGALGATGYGLGLLLFAFIDEIPFGWRAMYVVGLLPLLWIGNFRRNVKETRRFEAQRVRPVSDGLSGWLRPLVSLGIRYPGRTFAVALIGFLVSAAQTSGFSFAALHVQEVHGWSPGHYSLMAIAAGTLGIVGHPWAGRVADRRGRRIVGFALMASFPPLSLAFYHGPGWLLPFVWIPLIFTLTGTSTIERAVASELFPTSFRGTASGWLQLTEAAGRAAGLFVVAWGTPEGSSAVPMLDWVVFASLAAGLVLLCVPETGRRELEEISVEA